MGACKASRSKINGLEPITCPRISTPNNIDIIKTCESMTMAITEGSHFLAKKRSTNAKHICQNDHNKKLPSCPSQKQEIIYLVGKVVLE